MFNFLVATPLEQLGKGHAFVTPVLLQFILFCYNYISSLFWIFIYVLKFQHMKRKKTRWETPPLHFCEASQKPSPCTWHNPQPAGVPAPGSWQGGGCDGCLPPGESLRRPCGCQAVQGVWLEKLNIFMKELKHFSFSADEVGVIESNWNGVTRLVQDFISK